jgi:hypothetical protein
VTRSHKGGWVANCRACFESSGLTDITTHPSTVLFGDLDVTYPLILGTALQAALNTDAVDEGQAEAWLQDLRERNEQGRFFGSFTFYEVGGVKT